MTQRILVNSSQRQFGSATDFALHFPTSFNNISRSELHWTEIPLNTYNVTTANQTVTFYENTTTKTATLAIGRYDIFALISLLQSALNTASSGFNTYSVTYSISTFKITISGTQNFKLLWSNATSPSKLFGFAATDTSTATSVTSTNAVNVQDPLNVNIRIREFNQPVYVGGTVGQFDSTFIVPLVEGSTYVNYYEGRTPQVIDFNPVNFSRLHIRLTDSNNTLLDLNGSDWQCLITVYPAASNPGTKRSYDMMTIN